MSIIINNSILKKKLSKYTSYILSEGDINYYLNFLKNNKNFSFPDEFILAFQIFATFSLELHHNLFKIKFLVNNFDDTFFVDILSVDQYNLLQNFSFFLIKFWSEGLKLLITSISIVLPRHNLPQIFDMHWCIIFHFWYDIPLLLDELKVFLYVPEYKSLSNDVCLEFYNYLNSNESIVYAFSLYKALDSNKYLYSWTNNSLLLHLSIYSNWKQLDNNFLFYLLSLLKVSNQNFTFKVKKLYADAEFESLD